MKTSTIIKKILTMHATITRLRDGIEREMRKVIKRERANEDKLRDVMRELSLNYEYTDEQIDLFTAYLSAENGCFSEEDTLALDFWMVIFKRARD